MNKTKKTALNLVTDVIPLLIILIVGENLFDNGK